MQASSVHAALALVAVLATSACAATTQTAGGDPFEGSTQRDEILLTVENNDFRDATIHVYWNGLRTRAGIVTGKTTETFRLPWRSEWAHIGVDFLGGGGYETEQVPVNPGEHLNFVIMIGR